MVKSYSVLPCNGMDKCAGCISREIAVKLSEKTDSEIICPVLYSVADARYNKVINEKPLLVIDGCGTRCASKLAGEKGVKIVEKINVTDEAKEAGITIGKSLRLEESEMKLADLVFDELAKEKVVEENNEEEASSVQFPEKFDYEIYKKDKFIFRVPKGDFYFNENDCWVLVIDNIARIGVTDYVQQNLSDIMFFTPPEVGNEIEQFGEIGDVESGKAVFEIVSPVSGKITKINEKLLEEPELINENPYEKGWIAEVELSDFEEDKDLLLQFDEYFGTMKRKVDEFHV